MKINEIAIRNFRRLELVSTSIEERETVFVGPNNSGKTSATVVFRCFLGQRKFGVFDFSVSRISDIDAFGSEGDPTCLPAIELDIWFKVDPDAIEFGRVFTLLPNLSGDFTRLGLRLSYSASNPAELRSAYLKTYPPDDDGKSTKPLSAFLAQDSNLAKFFDVSYFALETVGDETVASELLQGEGKSLLRNLIRIDFVDAQRNIDDEEAHRSNRLSNAFSAFYKNNLEQADAAAEAQEVIDENNQKLTDHYATQFEGLMDVIKGLGVPSVNDRDLKIISTLSPETASKATQIFFILIRRETMNSPSYTTALDSKI